MGAQGGGRSVPEQPFRLLRDQSAALTEQGDGVADRDESALDHRGVQCHSSAEVASDGLEELDEHIADAEPAARPLTLGQSVH